MSLVLALGSHDIPNWLPTLLARKNFDWNEICFLGLFGILVSGMISISQEEKIRYLACVMHREYIT